MLDMGAGLGHGSYLMSKPPFIGVDFESVIIFNSFESCVRGTDEKS